MDAQEVVRSPKLWHEMAEVLRLQAAYMDSVADAIQYNNHEQLLVSLSDLTQLAVNRATQLNSLAPAMESLMTEVFREEHERQSDDEADAADHAENDGEV